MMVVIGLTGGICSGKSTVSQFLTRLGAVVLDADKLGHEILEPHTEAWQKVVTVFGEGILKAGGEINRQKLGEIVFSDSEALATLNRITHPGMYYMAEKRIDELKQKGSELIVLEASLLIEADWLSLVDQVWVTVASKETMVYRLCQRSGLSEAQAFARIRTQLPAEDKTKYADVVINTDCTLGEVEAKIQELWKALHEKIMKERIRQALSQRQKKVIKKKGPAPAAILIPIYEKKGEYYLILTKRTERVSNHKGQISFPGGSHQVGDRTLRDTAIRESCEEIGINPRDVEILGELDDIETNTNFVISPFVAAIPYPYEFRSNPPEVEEIIEVPIAALLDKKNIKGEQKYRDGKLFYEYSYEYKGWMIWGATARILKQFLDVVFEHNRI